MTHYIPLHPRIIETPVAYLTDVDPPPQVRITSPHVGHLYNPGMKKNPIGEFQTTVIDAIWNWTEVDIATVPTQQTESYYNRTMIFTDTKPPNKRRFNKISLRKHESTVIIYDGPGRTSSDWREIRLYQPSKRLR